MELTANTSTLRICVNDESYIGTARRAVRDHATAIGLSGQALDRLDILSTELASNLCKYADSGREILINNLTDDDTKTITLICIDRGPGIADISKALIDGMSTKSTLGAGLGSIKRLSDKFEIGSTVGKGTIVISTIRDTDSNPSKREKTGALSPFDLAWLSVPHPAEKRCGDAVAVSQSSECLSILVIDGLGHGNGAAEVSSQACAIFEQNPFLDARTILGRINDGLAGGRGAALALVQIDKHNNQLNFVGVGNIAGRVYSNYTSTGCVSAQGIVGEKIRTLIDNNQPWSNGSILLMHSDGIKSSASFEPSTPGKSALMLAAEIYRDYNRANDDTTVVVVIDKRSK